MKTRQRFAQGLASAAITAVAALAGTAAFAQEATSDTWMNAASAKTRAEVQAELQQARADGSIRFSRAGYIETLKSTKTREAVKAETLAARRSGELQHINAEVYGYELRQAPAVTTARR